MEGALEHSLTLACPQEACVAVVTACFLSFGGERVEGLAEALCERMSGGAEIGIDGLDGAGGTRRGRVHGSGEASRFEQEIGGLVCGGGFSAGWG
jgi:hypothetical protein